MRIAPTLLVSLSLTLAACSAEAPAPNPDSGDNAASQPAPESPGATGTETAAGTVYGEPIGAAPLVALADLSANMADYDGQRVRVEGLVTDVCAKRGCWVRIGAEEGPVSVRFKVVDGVIVFPMSAKGAQIEAEGLVTRHELDLQATRDALAREAEEKGEEFDAATVTEPRVYYQFAGLGAVVRSAD